MVALCGVVGSCSVPLLVGCELERHVSGCMGVNDCLETGSDMDCGLWDQFV